MFGRHPSPPGTWIWPSVEHALTEASQWITQGLCTIWFRAPGHPWDHLPLTSYCSCVTMHLHASQEVQGDLLDKVSVAAFWLTNFWHTLSRLMTKPALPLKLCLGWEGSWETCMRPCHRRSGDRTPLCCRLWYTQNQSQWSWDNHSQWREDSCPWDCSGCICEHKGRQGHEQCQLQRKVRDAMAMA